MRSARSASRTDDPVSGVSALTTATMGSSTTTWSARPGVERRALDDHADRDVAAQQPGQLVDRDPRACGLVVGLDTAMRVSGAALLAVALIAAILMRRN